MTTARRLVGGGLALIILAFVPASSSAQTWRAEKVRLDTEVGHLIERLRADGAEDISGISNELEPLHIEYLEKVVRPALREARTCRQRTEAVEILIGHERRAQLLDLPGTDDLGTLLSSAYSDEMYEQCMNELYRACVFEDNPMYAFRMSEWVVGHERQKQLLGGGDNADLDLFSELDPRITKCRGPWYQVRIVVERSGTEPDTGPWRDSDVAEGWLGRGLTGRVAQSWRGRHPGLFTRRAEQMSYGARCPDGGCPGICTFTAVADGEATVEYEHDDDFTSRILSIDFRDGEGQERLERNDCPHSDLPVSLYPGGFYEARFPADPVSPLTEDFQLPEGADPAVTEAFDQWPTMFSSNVVELEVDYEPIGRLEVTRVCDGQEIWGGDNGSPECQRRWQQYVELYRRQHPSVMPELPWERKDRNDGQ